jgi:zinc transport system permease protein
MLISALLFFSVNSPANFTKFQGNNHHLGPFRHISVLSGIFVSFALNLPAGATIVIINFIFFAAAFTVTA